MKINLATFLDPDDFKISPLKVTSQRRALDGTLYGVVSDRRDELEITFDSLTHAQATALTDLLYENSAVFVTFDLEFKRASSSDIQDCTDAFKGVVEWVDDTISVSKDPSYSRSLILTFSVHTYEIF